MLRLLSVADLLLLLLASAVLGYSWQSLLGQPDATEAQILHGSELLQTVELVSQPDIAVTGLLGESIFQIEDGRIRFSESPCRHQVCINTGWISRAGAVAACLPNRISVVLAGHRPLMDYDAEAF